MQAIVSTSAVVIAAVLLAGGCCLARPDGGFGFPSAPEVNAGQRNSQNKSPIYAPHRCAENELLYPADYNNEWVCDCKPGLLYYPVTSRCFEPQRQGPCNDNHILTLPAGTFLPKCVRNACPQGDGYVSFRGACHLLGEAGPCPLPELGYAVAVNETTLQPDCVRHVEQAQLQMRFGEDEDEVTTVAPVSEAAAACPVGSRRWLLRQCSDVEVPKANVD